jgi:hypothetical protein
MQHQSKCIGHPIAIRFKLVFSGYHNEKLPTWQRRVFIIFGIFLAAPVFLHGK